MKQSLQYGILLIVTFLLHSLLTEAVGEVTLPADSGHSKCIVSQAHPKRNAIDKFYLFCSPLSCDMGHADLSSHVPADKSLTRLATRMCGHKGMFPFLYKHSFHLYSHDPEDPIMHYIYGQRKIVI